MTGEIVEDPAADPADDPVGWLGCLDELRAVADRLRAQVAALPAERSFQSVSDPTCTGVGRSTVVPSPIWPLLLLPQAQAVPSDFTATMWFMPAASATTPESPLTCTGE